MSSDQISSPRDGIDFESLPWNINCTEGDNNYIHMTTTDGSWESGEARKTLSVKPYSSSPLGIFPSTTSLNYGTTIWEGLKCYRTSDTTAAIFRPDMNWRRFCNGAKAMCLPAPSWETFSQCLQMAVQHNTDLIPPVGDGMKLYIRPMLLGSGQQLGLYPSAEMTMLFFVSPTGNYFKGKAVGGLKLHLETNRCRAARGGTGSVKCAGNYAVALRPLLDAKEESFDDNLYMELETYRREEGGKLEDAVVQELSAANIFLVLRTGEIVTPGLQRGTILPGVTRDSVLVLAREFAGELKEAMEASTGEAVGEVTVSERDVTVKEFQEAAEVFITGTAAEIVPVASLATGTKDAEEFKVTFPHGETMPGGPVTAKLLTMLRETMMGTRTCEATKDWNRDPLAFGETFRKGVVDDS